MIIVTGGAGFIGSNLIHQLNQRRRAQHPARRQLRPRAQPYRA